MNLTMLPFEDEDFEIAAAIAKSKGRADENCIYTTTSEIIGMQWLSRFNRDNIVFSVIKTKELGFLVIQDLIDLNIESDMRRQFPNSI